MTHVLTADSLLAPINNISHQEKIDKLRLFPPNGSGMIIHIIKLEKLWEVRH